MVSLPFLTWKASQKLSLVFGTILAFIIIGLFGMWEDTMSTLAIISVATLLCLLIGTPFGILMAKSNRVSLVMSPVLDTMQTIPTFLFI